MANSNSTSVNSKLSKLTEKYNKIIERACADAGALHEATFVKSEIMLKIAKGKLVYDPTRGAKESTLLYIVAFRIAREAIRRTHPERFIEMDDTQWEKVGGEDYGRYAFENEDAQLITREALNRFAKECDERTIELLVRYMMLKQDREAVASHFGMTPDNVSLIKNRWWSRLVTHAHQALHEDEKGQLVLSPMHVAFLRPLLPWL